MLFISHSSGSGGAEQALLVLLKNIDLERYCPLVIGPESGLFSKAIAQLNIKSFELSFPWWFRSSSSYDIQSIFGHSLSSPWTEWSIPNTNDLSARAFNERIEFLSKIIHDNQIQLVHTNSVTIIDGALAAKLNNVPHIWHVHEFIDKHPSLEPMLPRSAIELLFREFCEAVITPSSALSNSLSQYVALDKIRRIFNGIKIPDADPEEAVVSMNRSKYEREFALNPSQLLVSVVGNGNPEKGWGIVPEVAKILAARGVDAKFVLVGPYDQHSAYCKNLIQSLKDRTLKETVILTGFRDDAVDIIRASDVLFQPSIVDCLPTVVAEAMALGKTVVGTYSGGMPEMIDHGVTGLIVPPEDSMAMANALAKLLQDAGKRKIFGENARKVAAEKFNPVTYANNIMSLYDEILSRTAKSNPLNEELLQDYVKVFGELCATTSGLAALSNLKSVLMRNPEMETIWKVRIRFDRWIKIFRYVLRHLALR